MVLHEGKEKVLFAKTFYDYIMGRILEEALWARVATYRSFRHASSSVLIDKGKGNGIGALVGTRGLIYRPTCGYIAWLLHHIEGLPTVYYYTTLYDIFQFYRFHPNHRHLGQVLRVTDVQMR